MIPRVAKGRVEMRKGTKGENRDDSELHKKRAGEERANTVLPRKDGEKVAALPWIEPK
jgi:hypothetical protein